MIAQPGHAGGAVSNGSVDPGARYQPIAELVHESLRGGEALLRVAPGGDHPEESPVQNMAAASVSTVEPKEQVGARVHEIGQVCERGRHVGDVMQHPQAENDVEPAEPGHALGEIADGERGILDTSLGGQRRGGFDCARRDIDADKPHVWEVTGECQGGVPRAAPYIGHAGRGPDIWRAQPTGEVALKDEALPPGMVETRKGPSLVVRHHLPGGPDGVSRTGWDW